MQEYANTYRKCYNRCKAAIAARTRLFQSFSANLAQHFATEEFVANPDHSETLNIMHGGH